MGASGASGSCSNGLSISSGVTPIVTASAAVKQCRIHSVRKRVLYVEWHVVMTYYYLLLRIIDLIAIHGNCNNDVIIM